MTSDERERLAEKYAKETQVRLNAHLGVEVVPAWAPLAGAYCAGYDARQKEIDELRQEMSTSAEAIVRLGDEYARLREERDHLRAENAELRTKLDCALSDTSVKHKYRADCLERSNDDLRTENEKNRSVIEAAKDVQSANKESSRYSDRMTNALRGLYDQLDELCAAGENSDYRGT